MEKIFSCCFWKKNLSLNFKMNIRKNGHQMTEKNTHRLYFSSNIFIENFQYFLSYIFDISENTSKLF